MNNKNYHIVVHGWMVDKLSLRGNELLVYALINGFSQDGESKFYGSHLYISEAIGVNKENARLILKRLCDKGLIIKHEDIISGVKFCKYTANKGTTTDLVVSATETMSPTTKTRDNNIVYNIDIIKETNTITNEIDIIIKEKTAFEKYNDWIKDKMTNVAKLKTQMTEDNFNWLVNEHGKDALIEIIQDMQNCATLNKKYTSVYLTARQWLKRRKDGK